MGSQAFAGPIPTFTATSVNISTMTGGPEQDTISASGPSFTLGGTISLPGIFQSFIPIGVPVQLTVFDMPRCCQGQRVGGGIAGSNAEVSIEGSVEVSPPSNTFIVLPSTPIAESVIIPGVATGSFIARSCPIPEPVEFCSGPQIANIDINLPGYVTLDIFSNPPFFLQGFDEVASARFTSTPTPEPSSISLLLVGFVVVTVLTRYRLRPLQR
jgi:hypothetical protein